MLEPWQENNEGASPEVAYNGAGTLERSVGVTGGLKCENAIQDLPPADV